MSEAATTKSAPSSTVESADGLDDPAIAGAKLNKNTVTLGYDPTIADTAQTCAELDGALKSAKRQFEIFQAQMRDYGAEKRVKYNDAFRNNVTTVQVPFSVEIADDGTSATPGRETRFVQVICTNRYAVSAGPILQLRGEMDPATFDRLFSVTEVKTLKQDAEDLIRELFGELGIVGKDLDNAMDRLLETKLTVKTTGNYEQEVEKVDEATQTILSQVVRRQQPGLKFS